MDRARETAVRVLYQVHEEGAYANVALSQALRKEKLSEQDRRFVTELVYGTVRAGETLDWILRRYLTKPLSKMQPLVREILRMGIYQISYLDRVPASAVCNTSVELARRLGFPRLTGLVNGVLRTAIREPGRAAFPTGKGHAIEELALRTMHPQWLVRHFVQTMGFEEAEKLCEFDNMEPVLSVRTNTLRLEREALVARLRTDGVETSLSPWTPEGILLSSHRSLDALAPLREGLCQVQDESSMLVAHVASPRPGDFVIDSCAAPGGKTTHLAALMGNVGKIVATDIYPHKIQRIEENAARLGVTIIEPLLLDAREVGARFTEKADVVLVDAPCSGLGVLRRKGDMRWRKTEEDLRFLPKLQREILDGAAGAVKPGGTLVYSTCTIEKAGNGDVVKAFLASHPDFSLDRTGSFLPCNSCHAEDDMVQLLPQRDGTDGFFIARMKRDRR